MKRNIPLNILPLIALAAISANRLLAVKPGGVQHATSEDRVIGVSGPLDVPEGHAVDVVTAGFIPVEFETAANEGDPIGASADGKAKVVDAADALFIAVETVEGGDIGSVIKAL